MLTYVGYLVIGSFAAISLGHTWVIVAWFGIVAVDWSVSAYQKITRKLVCRECGANSGFKYVKKVKNNDI